MRLLCSCGEITMLWRCSCDLNSSSTRHSFCSGLESPALLCSALFCSHCIPLLRIIQIWLVFISNENLSLYHSLTHRKCSVKTPVFRAFRHVLSFAHTRFHLQIRYTNKCKGFYEHYRRQYNQAVNIVVLSLCLSLSPSMYVLFFSLVVAALAVSFG